MKSTIERLRDLRVDHDLTQEDVAKILGISQQHYSLYETGGYELPLRHFVALADYYNVPADYMLGRSALDEKSLADTVYITKDYTGARFINSVVKLSDSNKESLVLYLEFLLYLKEKRKK